MIRRVSHRRFLTAGWLLASALLLCGGACSSTSTNEAPSSGGSAGAGASSSGGLGGAAGGDSSVEADTGSPDVSLDAVADSESDADSGSDADASGDSGSDADASGDSGPDALGDAGCAKGSTQCNGTNVETCDGSGQWVISQTCPGVPNGTAKCVGGACSFDCNSGYADCDGNPANGCESDLQSALSCGACGKKCCGTCSSGGICLPANTGVVTNSKFYDVSETTIYSAQDSDNDGVVDRINSKLLFGGAQTPLWTDQKQVSWITVVPQGLLWSNKGTVKGDALASNVDGGVYLNGSSITQGSLYGNDASWTGFDGSNYYWQYAYASVVYGTQDVSKMIPQLSPYQGLGAAFAGGAVYFVYFGDKTKIQKWVLPNQSKQTFEAVLGQEYESPVTDGTSIFYMVTKPPADVGIWKKPIVGGAPIKLVSAQIRSTNWISTDGTWVYWFDITGVSDPTVDPSKVMKVSVNGGLPLQIGTIIYPEQYPRFNNSCVFGFSNGPAGLGPSIVGMGKN